MNSKTKMLLFYFRDLELHIKVFRIRHDFLVYKWEAHWCAGDYIKGHWKKATNSGMDSWYWFMEYNNYN